MKTYYLKKKSVSKYHSKLDLRIYLRSKNITKCLIYHANIQLNICWAQPVFPIFHYSLQNILEILKSVSGEERVIIYFLVVVLTSDFW